MSETKKPLLITRYASRKLYDPQAKEYVTLDDISGYIAEGYDVQIVDRKTGEDLTGQYLVQIIAEREGRGDSPLPVKVLMDLVRMYQEKASALTPDFLSDAVEAFKKQQAQFFGELGKASDAMTDPAKAMNAMQDWQRLQSDMMRQNFGAFMGKSSAEETSSQEPKSPADNADSDSTDERISALEAQLSALQEQLKNQGKN